MEFGIHLGKGFWGLADKSLPVAYGIGCVLLVIRVLPSEQFGNFVLIQEIFLVNIISLATSSCAGLALARSLFSLTLRPGHGVFSKVWTYECYSLGGVTSYLMYSKADTFLLSAFTGPIQVAIHNSVKIVVRVFEMASQVIQMFVLAMASKLSSGGDVRALRGLTETAILFSTVSLRIGFVVFFVIPGLLIGVVYQGRYGEAVPILQLFSAATLVAPATSVGSSVLMGLGLAKEGFILGLQMRISSIAAYLVFIPLLGVTGAAVGYGASCHLMAWLTVARMSRVVPVTARGILERTLDIGAFVARRLSPHDRWH